MMEFFVHIQAFVKMIVTMLLLVGAMEFSISPEALAGDEGSLFWQEKTKEHESSIKYERRSKKVVIKYDPRGAFNSEKWEFDVSSFELVALAQSSIESSLKKEKAPEQLISTIVSKLEGLKYLDSSSCRVLHLPVAPFHLEQTNQYFGILEELTGRNLASNSDQQKSFLADIDESIYRTQKLFQIVTADKEEYEVLVGLDENNRIKALSINKNGESLANHQIEINNDSVVIRDKEGTELFSYMVEFDQETDSGKDELWLSIFTPRNALGLSQKENFRIHTENGSDYLAYRYKTLSDLNPEDFVRFDERQNFDPSLQETIENLREVFALNLVMPEKIENCPNQRECSLNILLEKVMEETLVNLELPVEVKERLSNEYKQCLVEEEVLQKFGAQLVGTPKKDKAPGIRVCKRVLGLAASSYSVETFLSSRFLTLNVESNLGDITRKCRTKAHRDVLIMCVSRFQTFQGHLANIQPSFHQSFLQEIEGCLEKTKSSRMHDRVEAINSCVQDHSQKYSKARNVESYVEMTDRMPKLIQDRFDSRELSVFLESCTESNCVQAYVAQQYEKEIIPSIFKDYIFNDADNQRLTNRLMRGLRRIHRRNLPPDEYGAALKEFEIEILNQAMNSGMENLLLEEMNERDPSLFEKDEQGRLTRAAETYNYERAENQIWLDFLSYKHIPVLDSVDESLKGYVNKAVSDYGIEGGRTAANQLMKDFYLWSSDRKNEITLSQNDLYQDRELAYRVEDAKDELEECFDSYRPTHRERSVGDFIQACEIKRLKSISYYRGKKVFEKEISKYFDLQTIKANELMGINRFLKRCLRDKEKSAKNLEDFKAGSMRCLLVAFIDLKQNIYKYQSIDENLTQLAKGNTIYAESFQCLRKAFLEHEKAARLDEGVKDGVSRLIDFSYTAPTTIRYMSSIYSSVGYDSIENYEKYRGNLSSFFDQLSADDCEEFVKNLEEGCFAEFESARVQAVRDGIVKLAGLDSLNLTTNLNESAKEVFADAIDLELVKMLLSDDYLLDEEFFELRIAGNSPDTQYVNKKMTIDFLVNTVNGISNLLKEGFYSDPDQAKTALVTFSSRLKELIELAKANKRPFHMHDLLGILQQHSLFDTLAIGYLSKHMRQKITAGLLAFRDEQLKQNNIRQPEVKKLVEGQIRSENILMRNAAYRALRSDKTYRTAGLYSTSSDREGREIIKLIKEKIILPQLLGGEPTVETLDDLNKKIVKFFDDRQNTNIFFAGAAREFRNNTYIMTRESQWPGNGASAYFRLTRDRDEFLENFDSTTHRTSYIHKIADGILIEPFRDDNSHFKDILNQEWQQGSLDTFNLMRKIAD